MSRTDPDYVESVDRAFRILQAFSAEDPLLSVSRAAELTGISRPAARRLLLTFERLKFVQAEHGMFRLTPRVLRIGYGYLSCFPIWEHAEPQLRELATAVNEACSAATLDEGDIVYVARVPPKRSMSITLTIGSRLPAYPTSMGRVLLASLSPELFESYLEHTTLQALTPQTVTDRAQFREIIARTRIDGFAVVDGEREEGVRSAAAPLTRRDGTVLAAINVSVNAARVSLDRLHDEIVPMLLDTADEISRDIVSIAPLGSIGM